MSIHTQSAGIPGTKRVRCYCRECGRYVKTLTYTAPDIQKAPEEARDVHPSECPDCNGSPV